MNHNLPNEPRKVSLTLVDLFLLLLDGDGLMELVIGYSDRRVRSFRWMDAGRDPTTGMLQGKFIPLENWQLAGQVGRVCQLMVDNKLSRVDNIYLRYWYKP